MFLHRLSLTVFFIFFASYLAFFHLHLFPPSFPKCLSICAPSLPSYFYLFMWFSRSLSLGLSGLSGLDDRLLPEGSAGLPWRQAADVLQGRDRPDAVALLHHWGEDRGLRPLCLRLPTLLWHIHRQPLVRHMWPDTKKSMSKMRHLSCITTAGSPTEIKDKLLKQSY